MFFGGKEPAEVQANGEGLDRLAAEPRSPPRIPRAQSPRTLAEVGRSRNPAGGNRRGLRSHNSDSRGIGGDRGLSNSRSIISHARAGKGSNLFDNEASNCGLDRQAHSEHELLLVADWHDRELRGLSPIGKQPTPKRGAWFGLFLASCRGGMWKFNHSDPLRLSWNSEAPLRRGVFFVGSQGRGGMRVLPARLTRWTLAQAGHRSEMYTLSSGTSSAYQT